MTSCAVTLPAERDARLSELMDESFSLYKRAVREHVDADSRRLVATCILFSGGNDSTVLAHLFRWIASHAVHVNTGIGIEETRRFVRSTCYEWGLPLIEEHPPAGSTYEELVLSQGFPGPAHHWKMYQRLKERGLRQARAKLVIKPRQERVIYLAGRRRDESKRRLNVPDIERVGSVVWVSPLVNWTKLDLNWYRRVYKVPANPVADTLHMSGECLCGAFAKKGELDEISYWYPKVGEQIRALEGKVRAAGHPEERCHWGWGAYRDVKRSKSGRMCSSCDGRMEDV